MRINSFLHVTFFCIYASNIENGSDQRKAFCNYLPTPDMAVYNGLPPIPSNYVELASYPPTDWLIQNDCSEMNFKASERTKEQLEAICLRISSCKG